MSQKVANELIHVAVGENVPRGLASVPPFELRIGKIYSKSSNTRSQRVTGSLNLNPRAIMYYF